MAFNIYKWRRDQLLLENENPSSAITKKLKDITWEDVKGLYVPTSDPDTFQNMDARDLFSDKWREETLENWKEKLRTFFPNADEFKITIDRSNPTWFKTVTINNDEYNALMARKSKAKQADIEKSGERLDEIEGDPDDYYGYNEPIDPNTYADDPGYNDKVAFLVQAFQHVWGMGKGNNTIDFVSLAKSTIEDLETRF
jgi:hypothetical protein